MTMVFMPMVMTIILPIIYLVPVTTLSAESTNPVQLTFNIQNSYDGMTFSNGYYTNTSFQDCVLDNVILDGLPGQRWLSQLLAGFAIPR